MRNACFELTCNLGQPQRGLLLIVTYLCCKSSFLLLLSRCLVVVELGFVELENGSLEALEALHVS